MTLKSAKWIEVGTEVTPDLVVRIHRDTWIDIRYDGTRISPVAVLEVQPLVVVLLNWFRQNGFPRAHECVEEVNQGRGSP